MFTLGAAPKTYIHLDGGLVGDTIIDLREFSRRWKKEFGNDLVIFDIFDSDKKNTIIDVVEKNTHRPLIQIIIAIRVEYCNLLRVIKENAPLKLNCGANRMIATPIPLRLNATEITAITERDIEPNMDIIFNQNFGNINFFHYDDDLVIANTISPETSSSYIENVSSVILKDYYNSSEIFDTINLKFSDINISISDMKEHIQKAEIFEEWFEKF